MITAQTRPGVEALYAEVALLYRDVATDGEARCRQWLPDIERSAFIPGAHSRCLPRVSRARINCAHDDADIWSAMAANVRDGARRLDRECRI